MRTRDKVKCMPPWELIDCIIDAAKNGDCLQLGLYVKRCCELDIIDSLDESGRSALAWAVAEGHLEACKALIDHGADVSQPDEYNQTPLYVASRKGFAKVSELLLASGAVVDAIDIEGETPLGVAASKGHLHVLRVLAAGGADPMIKDDEGLTPLHKARRSGHSGCAEFLSQHIQQQNQAKQRPVHVLDGTARKPPLQFTPDWWSCTLGQLSEAIACHWSIPNPASSLSFGDQTGTFAVQPKLECSATLLALSSAGQVWVWPSRHTPIGRSIPVSTASEFLDSTPSDPQQKRPSSRQAPEPVSTPRSRKKSSLRKKKPAAKKSALSVASTPASKSCPAPSAVGAQSRCSAGPNREPRFDHKTAQPEEKTAADDEDDETAGCNGAVAEDSQSDYMDTVQAIVKQRAKAAKTGSQVSVGNAGSAVSQVQTPVRVQRPSAGVMREADSSPECYSLQAPVSRSTVNCELAFRNQPSLSPACQTPFSPFLSKKTSVKWSTDGKARGIGPLPDGSTLADKKAVASPASVASFCSSLQSSVKHASNSKFSRRRSAPSYGVENSKTVAKASAGSKLSKRSTRS
ncbi:Homeobox protein Wariai, partial [Diplonema papillatum]